MKSQYCGIIAVLGILCLFTACEGPMGPQGIQGETGAAGSQGQKGDDGLSIVWQGELAAAPANPQLNWAYFNTTVGNAYIYDGYNWQILSQRGADGANGASLLWLGEVTSHPANPQLNWAYYNSTEKKAYIFDGYVWRVLIKDGEIGPQGPQGESGVSIVWQGQQTSHPANPQINWAYYNSADKTAYVYDGNEWRILAKDGQASAPIIWKGEFSEAPTGPDGPQLNWAYYHSEDKKSYIFNGEAWQILAQDGEVGPQGPKGDKGDKGDTGDDGLSITWKGESASPPSGAQINWAYFNTVTGNAYIYNGTDWQLLSQRGASGSDGVSIIWQGEKASHPLSPQLNWAYYNSVNRKSYIWDGSVWQILAQDGEVGPQGPKGDKGDKGDTGDDGLSIIWKGESASPPSGAQINWAYFNTVTGNAYVYNGSVWELLALRGASGSDGVSIVWQGEYVSVNALIAAKGSPQLNWAYYNSVNRKSYIFNGSIWQILAQDGEVGPQGPKGDKGDKGDTGDNGGDTVPGATLAAQLSWLASNAQSDTNYILEVNADEDIDPTSLNYSGKNNITIYLRGIGSMRTVGLTANGSMFTIENGVTLVLDGNITLQGRSSNSSNPLVRVHTGGNLIMNAETKISGNSSSSNVGGGGVFVGDGTFTMTGGEISGNSFNSFNPGGGGGGSGVYVGSSGTFTMHGGEISGNSFNSSATTGVGGGVYVDSSGTFTMTGGEISGNSFNSSTSGGGGVYVGSSGTFTMHGGEISDNGSGVYVGSSGTFTMHDGEISDNGSGGVSVFYGTFTMTGGEISHNSSNSGSGGVYVGISGTFTMTGGEISHNSNSSSYRGGGGGVYVGSSGTFTMTGGEISHNSNSSNSSNSDSGGGGVCVGSRGTFTMTGGEISHNSNSSNSSNSSSYSGGGGVCVGSSGTFTMTGGEISSNSSSSSGGGVYVGNSGTFSKSGGNIYGDDYYPMRNTTTNGNGHAVFYWPSSPNPYYYRNNSLYTNHNLNTADPLPTNFGQTLNGWTRQ